ncbi:MAG: glycosyltransferase family 39 protein [Candidatus Woesearchaeota archaeon]
MLKKCKSFLKKHKKVVLLGFILIVLFYASFLRLYGLGHDSLWLDEGISSIAARSIVERGTPELDSSRVYSRASIFHYLMAGFLFFGVNDFNARLISVIVGVLTCLLAYLFGREFNEKTGVIALILCAVLKIFILYSRQARMYQFAMFLFFLALYLLYISFKEDKYLLYSIIVALIAYETHPIAILLLPFYAYYIVCRKFGKKVWIIYGIVALFFMYRSISLLEHLNFHMLSAYFDFLRSYAPFIFVALVGFVLSYKNKLSWILGASIFLVVVSASFGSVFAFRYVYLAFFPIVILASYALSQIKWSYFIVFCYIIWVSNIFNPFSYVTVLTPMKSISLNDFTSPTADFKGLYNELSLIYNDEILVVSVTPLASWYFRNPDYWLFFSMTGRMHDDVERHFEIYNGKDSFTGASIIFSEDIEGERIVVVDSWAKRMPGFNWSSEGCDLLIAKTNVNAYRCS